VLDLDALDLALLTALRENPRSGALALSRLTRVARATVEARLSRLERSGVITGYGPDIDVAAAGFSVLAFVTLEIAQGALDRVKADLAVIPAVLEAYAITGSADMICKVAATSHADLQQTLLRIDSSPSVARSTSAIALSTVIAPRDLPLLTSRAPSTTPRSPAFRLPPQPQRGSGAYPARSGPIYPHRPPETTAPRPGWGRGGGGLRSRGDL
jgi:DNA-binding Lrp family transcriptional regulator